MLKRLKIAVGVVGAFAALALGGAAIAGAASISPTTNAPAPELTTGPDVGANVQSGDQTTPDVASASASAGTTADGTIDTPESATSETATPNDGPGGYADTNANADTQQQGEN